MDIKINISGFEIPMRIDAKDEEVYRLAGKILNEKIRSYNVKFPNQNFTFIVIMAAYDLAVTNAKHQYQTDLEPLMSKMAELTGKIDNALTDAKK